MLIRLHILKNLKKYHKSDSAGYVLSQIVFGIHIAMDKHKVLHCLLSIPKCISKCCVLVLCAYTLHPYTNYVNLIVLCQETQASQFMLAPIVKTQMLVRVCIHFIHSCLSSFSSPLPISSFHFFPYSMISSILHVLSILTVAAGRQVA